MLRYLQRSRMCWEGWIGEVQWGGGALVSEGVLQIYELDADVYERSA